MARFNMTTEQLVSEVTSVLGNSFTTSQLREWVAEQGYSFPTINKRLEMYKTGRGQFNVVQQLEQTYQQESVEPIQIQSDITVKSVSQELVDLVPEQDPLFVPFGNFNDIKRIIKSNIFYPLFITGLSGNGKTHAVEQACAQLNREIIRINLTIETDEDSLIGGFRLVAGETVWSDGPVVQALRRGAILLLDEVDLASNKVMCLQSVLEGKGVYLKKINSYVRPAPGFNVVATANTKGRGDDTGRFMFTNNLNEAFLERFAVTFQQEYPTPTVETKILTKLASSLGLESVDERIKELTMWSEIIRKTFDEGGIDDVISTRRLIHVMRAYAIWNDMNKAIELTTNRFDDETRNVFLELFSKITSEEKTVTSTEETFNF
jgi:midasin (ATPase involved in ribosome maturation)